MKSLKINNPYYCVLLAVILLSGQLSAQDLKNNPGLDTKADDSDHFSLDNIDPLIPESIP